MLIVVAYDIPNDKRRTRLFKTLKNFGRPVQYSVFECLLTLDRIKRLKIAVRNVLDPKEDLVRYYYLCDACRRRIENHCQRLVVEDARMILV